MIAHTEPPRLSSFRSDLNMFAPNPRHARRTIVVHIDRNHFHEVETVSVSTARPSSSQTIYGAHYTGFVTIRPPCHKIPPATHLSSSSPAIPRHIIYCGKSSGDRDKPAATALRSTLVPLENAQSEICQAEVCSASPYVPYPHISAPARKQTGIRSAASDACERTAVGGDGVAENYLPRASFKSAA
jgi:hypothetical protein